jgi:hypothetical protein
MDEYTNGVPQYPLQQQAAPNGNPQINDKQLTPGWQPHAHQNNQNPKQEQHHNDRPQVPHYDFSSLNLQRPSLPHGPSISLSHDQADHLKKETAQLITQERRQLDEAEQILAMPGFLKAFDLFIKATQK